MGTLRIPDELQRLFPLTPAVFYVLLALAEGQKHGYAIMQAARVISEEKVRLGPGTLYSTIQRLLDLDLIEETEGDGVPSDHESSRRYYRLTRMGKAVLDAEVRHMESILRRAKKRKLFHEAAK